MTGTLINVRAVLAGTGIGVAVGTALPERFQRRVLAGPPPACCSASAR